jgi:uncharacterized membrane protein YqgA involved in biofilm formation
MINRLTRLTQLVGLNSIPVAGVMFDGWSNATALAIYWCETVIFVVLVFLRIHIHRMATKKRGHYVEVRVKSTGTAVPFKKKTGLFGTSFLAFALIFCIGQIFFVNFAVDLDSIRRDQLILGIKAVAAFLVLGFVIDLIGIRQRPFAWIRNMSMGALWRVFLVQFAIVAGVIGTGLFGWPRVTLITFVILKLYTDAVSQLPRSKLQEAERESAEEEIFAGKPMPFEASLIQRTDG